MSEPKWTPGPWHVDDTAGYLAIRTDPIEGLIPLHIAVPLMVDATDDGKMPETLANAALIAAAPTLEHAIRGAVAVLSEVAAMDIPSTSQAASFMLSVCQRALAKARGEQP